MLRTSRSARTLALLAALACAAVLAVPMGAAADGPLSDRATNTPQSTSPVGDRPADRDRYGTATGATVSSTSDDGGGGGMDAGLIVALSLAGVTLAGGAWVVARRRYHRPLIPRGSH